MPDDYTVTPQDLMKRTGIGLRYARALSRPEHPEHIECRVYPDSKGRERILYSAGAVETWLEEHTR